MIDGNKIGTCEGIVTIISGYDDNAKIKRFVLAAEGTPRDKFITLEDCRQIIGNTGFAIIVIFESYAHGDIYRYGNRGAFWEQIGETEGFA